MFLLAKVLKSQIHTDMMVLGRWARGGNEELVFKKIFFKWLVVLVAQQICI